MIQEVSDENDNENGHNIPSCSNNDKNNNNNNNNNIRIVVIIERSRSLQSLGPTWAFCKSIVMSAIARLQPRIG